MKGLGAGEGFIIGFILVAIVIVGLLIALGVFKLPTTPPVITGGCTVNSDCPTGYECVAKTCTAIKVVEGYPCQTDGTNSVFVSVRNPLNTSLQYQASTIYITNSKGQVVGSGTSTAGSALSYAEINVPCSADNAVGNVYAVGDATKNSAVGSYSFTKQTSDTVALDAENSDVLTGTLYSTTLANTSQPDMSAAITETAANAMSAGDTRSGYLDLKDATGKSQYGSSHSGNIWCVDTINSAAFTDTAISLSSQTGGFSLTEIPCTTYPKATSVDSCNRCWTSSAIKASGGTLRFSWSMTNDGGTDAGASDDPVLHIEDVNYFLDTSGKIALEAFNAAGTNQGESTVSVTWNNS